VDTEFMVARCLSIYFYIIHKMERERERERVEGRAGHKRRERRKVGDRAECVPTST